jgi:hypothetical protein
MHKPLVNPMGYGGLPIFTSKILEFISSNIWRIIWIIKLSFVFRITDHFCGLVARVPGYRCRGPGFDSKRYQISWVLGLERGQLSLVSTSEELLGRKRSGSGAEIREYCRRDPSRWPRGTLYPQKLALTSPISGGRSVSIVRSRTQATEFFFLQNYSICVCASL